MNLVVITSTNIAVTHYAPDQGAVESIALKDPKERTKMFEWISQSREYAAEYDVKKKAMLKAKEDTQFHFNKKKFASAERKQVSQEKIEVKSHTQLQWLVLHNPQSHHTLAVTLPASYFHNHSQTN